MPTNEKLNTKVITGKVRISYEHLLTAHSAFEKQEPRYSCVLLIPKSDRKTLRDLRAAQKAALENGRSTKFNGSIPKNWKDTIRDGDEEMDLEKNPEYKGMYFMTVANTTRPGIVGPDLSPLTTSDEVYSGMYARASLTAYAFNVQGNKGVSFGLNHIQKLADGEPFSGRSKAEDDFEEWDEDDDDDDEGADLL